MLRPNQIAGASQDADEQAPIIYADRGDICMLPWDEWRRLAAASLDQAIELLWAWWQDPDNPPDGVVRLLEANGHQIG